MLYKLGKTHQKFDSIDPLPFGGLPLEKELEDLLAANLWDVLFEGDELMPIFQERSWQPEADIYALNKQGDLVIFELKRDNAGGGAVHQALRYCEKAAHFGYGKLQEMFQTYNEGKALDLREEHRAGFDLEHPLERAAFNTKQHLIVVGSAGDAALIRNLDYWKSKGLSLSFIPYRVYNIGGEYYFEFFSLPYDHHSNPGSAKGVIFDTNLSYDEESIWYMCEKGRVAAFGGQKAIVHSLRKNDTVFLCHKNQGIIAAGKVATAKVAEDSDADALYHTLEWLTSKPTRGVPYKFMPVWQVKEVLDRDFYWARTIKRPHLSMDESTKLLAALVEIIGPKMPPP
ncbi:MAG TPA: hypothetical protein VK717_01800 [Opitutaceae bacterium]|jgi:hypothetical protein|nr:hypothetical protein [Opitutaceae bacterium]